MSTTLPEYVKPSRVTRRVKKSWRNRLSPMDPEYEEPVEDDGAYADDEPEPLDPPLYSGPNERGFV